MNFALITLTVIMTHQNHFKQSPSDLILCQLSIAHSTELECSFEKVNHIMSLLCLQPCNSLLSHSKCQLWCPRSYRPVTCSSLSTLSQPHPVQTGSTSRPSQAHTSSCCLKIPLTGWLFSEISTKAPRFIRSLIECNLVKKDFNPFFTQHPSYTPLLHFNFPVST